MDDYNKLTRVYVHARCEQPTIVGDHAFGNLSNPLCTTKLSYCSSCKRMFPLADFRWADTQESLPDYHARHSVKATKLERFLACNSVVFGVLIFSFLCGAVLGYILWPPAQASILGTAIMLFGTGVVLTIVLGSIYVFGFLPLINLRVCGYRDTRRLI